MTKERDDAKARCLTKLRAVTAEVKRRGLLICVDAGEAARLRKLGLWDDAAYREYRDPEAPTC